VVKFLDLVSQYESIKDDVDAAIARVIGTAAYIGGPDLKSFEAEFAAFQHAEFCIGVANGTDAIEIAIEALDLPPGSEILVPANSFISSSEAVTRQGHRVVFCEADPVTYTVDLADAERRITPATKAVVAVHLYGHPADLTGLMALAETHGLKIIEDCAQAHGAEIGGRRIGAIGHISAFSFYPGKNLGAYGDGGAILTNDAELARKSRMIANHGRIDKYDHKFEGRNSRLDGLQAAILRAKLAHLDSWIDRRNAVASRYLAELADLDWLILPTISAGIRHAFHLFVIRTTHRDALQAWLKSAGVESGIHYPIALTDLAAYDYLRGPDSPTRASATAPTLLSLPMGEHLSDSDVAQVIAAVRSFSPAA
jgi:dTDP-4-amino-4,6-dideoxygalactose transaminase